MELMDQMGCIFCIAVAVGEWPPRACCTMYILASCCKGAFVSVAPMVTGYCQYASFSISVFDFLDCLVRLNTSSYFIGQFVLSMNCLFVFVVSFPVGFICQFTSFFHYVHK